MRSVAKQALTSVVRANRPLGAAMNVNSGGVGLKTADINAWLANIFGQPRHFDQMRQYEKSAVVYRAVKMRADAVARAPLKAHRTKRTGELEWVGANHPVQQHLDRVNPWWTHADIWRGVETYLLLYGQAFRWVDKSATSVAEWEQWLLRPDKVVVIKDKAEYIKGFVYDPQGANFPMLPDEVIWDRYFNPLDEFAGLSPLASLQEVLQMRSEMITTNRNLFKNGALVQNLAFLFQTTLNQQQVDDFYRRIEERHATPENAQRPIVGDNGADVKNLGLTNREMEWMAGLKWTKDDTLTALEIPEEMLPGGESRTFDNRAEAERYFYRHTIANEWALLEASMQERFAPILPSEHQGLVLKFDTSIVEGMQEAIDEAADRWREDVKAGLRTPNEYRAKFGEPPHPDGDVLIAPSGTVPLATIAQGEPEPTEEPLDDDEEDEPRMVAEVRCERGHLTGRNIIEGSEQYCRKCKVTLVA